MTNPLIKWLIRAGAVASALMAIAAGWLAIGGPGIATSSDIRRLDRQQTDVATDVYTTKMRSLLVIAPPPGTPAHSAWQEELAHTRDQIKRAEDRKIELSK